MVAAPEASATSCCSAKATPPGAAHLPEWMCEMWLELNARPVSFTVSVNEAPLRTTSAVPATALPFWAAIAKVTFGAGDAALGVLPPQAATARIVINARRGLFTAPVIRRGEWLVAMGAHCT